MDFLFSVEVNAVDWKIRENKLNEPNIESDIVSKWLNWYNKRNEWLYLECVCISVNVTNSKHRSTIFFENSN